MIRPLAASISQRIAEMEPNNTFTSHVSLLSVLPLPKEQPFGLAVNSVYQTKNGPPVVYRKFPPKTVADEAYGIWMGLTGQSNGTLAILANRILLNQSRLKRLQQNKSSKAHDGVLLRRFTGAVYIPNLFGSITHRKKTVSKEIQADLIDYIYTWYAMECYTKLLRTEYEYKLKMEHVYTLNTKLIQTIPKAILDRAFSCIHV